MIKEVKKLVFTLILLQLSMQCGEGCLKCSTETQCELCDTQNAYIQQEGKCVRQLQENCLAYNLEGNCTECINNFYLIEQVRKCIPVENINLVQNCASYNTLSLCQACLPQFYLAGNKCVSVDLKIENCEIYDTSKTCAICIDGFLLSINKRQCMPIETTVNCLSYSLNKCIHCNENSLLQHQKYYQDFLNERADDFTGLNKYQVFNYFRGDPIYYQEFCIKTLVPNCVEFEDYKTCSKCKSGYFLQDNLCKENPKNFISNCKNYKSPKECIECLNGFYLLSPTQCLPVDIMESCEIYDGKASFSSCLRCTQDKYLQTSTTCTLRTHPLIENCAELHASKDFCGICVKGFDFTSEFLKCLPLIPNCLDYDHTITSTADSLKCQQCEKGFYLNNNVCELGTLENCLVYQVNSNSCELCKNKYYLEGGICKLHSSLSYCQDYNPLVVGKCDKCQVGTEQFLQSTYCNPVNEIENCVEYSDINICKRCDWGFNRRLVENSEDIFECLPIPQELNCEYMLSDVCQQCKEGFYFENQHCLEPLKTELIDCFEKGNIVAGYQQCKICQESFISYNYVDHRVCFLPDEHFRRYIGVDQPYPENCKMMKMNGDVIQCLKCKDDFLLTDQSICIPEDQCIGSIRRIVFVVENQKIVDVLKNVCVNVQSTCELQAMNINPNGTVTYHCAKCVPGYDKIVNFSEKDEIILLSQDVPLQDYQSENDYTYRAIKSVCEVANQTQRKPAPVNVPIFNNCEYWYKFNLFGEKGCARCSHKHYGEVKNWGVEHCFMYDDVNKVCKKCLNQFALSANGLKCNSLNIIPQCQWYKENISTCQKCKHGFYLSNNQCLPVTHVEECKTYQINQNKCVECEPSFYLYQNQALQQFCIQPIYKCEQYRYITSVDDIVVCTHCADGYYPDSIEGCVKGTVPNCWQYEQISSQNVCKQYVNQIPFISQNYCQRVEPLEGCLTYTSKVNYLGNYYIVCDKCDDNSHYKSGEICCPFGMYNNFGKCDYILINECKESTSALTCDKCNDYYFFDLFMSELTIPYKCCGVGTYWNPITSSCSKFVEVAENNNHCVLFEKTTIKSCLVCEEGYYVSQNDVADSAPSLFGYCCPIGQKYVYSEVLGHTCEAIEFAYCAKANCTYEARALSYQGTITCVCNECLKGYTIYGANNNYCCNDDTEYYNAASGCLPKPTGCDTYDAANSKCTKCKQNFKQYTKVDGNTAVVCCDYKANPRQWYQDLSDQTSCTNQGDTSQNNVSFIYSGDSNCILTDFTSTHATINDASCIECVENYSPSGYKSQKCCLEGTMWNGIQQKCLHNQYFNNCIQIKTLTALTDAFCSTCKSGYYLSNGVCTENGKSFQYIQQDDKFEFQTIVKSNCLQLQDGANNDTSVCTKCSDTYNVSSGSCVKKMEVTVQNNKYELKELVKNCLLFDIQSYNCSHCRGNALKLDGVLCCYPHQKIENNKCVDPIDANEKLLNLKTNNPVENCALYDQKTCVRCQQNFILVAGSKCIPIIEAQQSCNFNKINENCLEISLTDLTNCTCTTCQYFAYKSNGICCPYGTKWNSTLNQCEQLKDPLCAKHDGNNCTECFEDPSKRLVLGNFAMTTVKDDNYVLGQGGQKIKTEMDTFSAKYYLNQGVCCPVGTYNKSGVCVAITQTGCKQASLVNNVELCTVCTDMKQEPNENGACANKTDTTTLYIPTNSPISVKFGMTWDYIQQKASKILDPNCLQTSNIHSCDTCATNYSLGNFIAKFEMNLYQNKYHDGQRKITNVRLCQNLGDNILDQFELRRYKYCQDWNNATGECTECESGRYLTRGICCQQGQVGVNSNGVLYCSPIQDQQTNCDHYNISNGQCKLCASTHTTNWGSCCANDGVTNNERNTYMDLFNYEANCDVKPKNCYLYNIQAQQCEVCEQNYKEINGVCIQEGKTISNNQVIDTYEVIAGCQQLRMDGTCLTPVSGNYLYNGISCPTGFYSKDGVNCYNTIASIGDYYQFCTKVNMFKHCTECTIGSYISNNRCCLKGMYFDNNFKKCIPIYKFKNCLDAVFDKQGDCKKCKEGHYLSRGFCVPEGKLVIDEIGTEYDIQIQNCIQGQTVTTCQKCIGDQVIFNNTCQYYIDIDEDQRIGECKIITSGTPPVCQECKENKYLNYNNCCSYGFYFNGNSCQSLETISKNCATWINGQCASCLPENGMETYLSNQLACCQNGFFASSSTFCRPIELIQNCLQTDNELSCKLCAPGFKQINGNCVAMNIPNCSIGINEQECVICNKGFYLDKEIHQCLPQPIIEFCIAMEDNTKNCALCETGRYWDGYSCCEQTFVTLLTGVPLDQVQCVPQVKIALQNCSKIQNEDCTECSSGYRVSNGHCCPPGEYPIDGVCTPKVENGLTKCKQYINETSCAYITNEIGNDVSCIENNYFTMDKCCPVGTYWSGTDCLQFQGSLANCKKQSSSFCEQCADGMNLSQGQCIASGKYNLLGVETNIPQPNCIKLDPFNKYLCLECATNYSLTLGGRCCSKADDLYIYDPKTQTCIQPTGTANNPTDINLITGNYSCQTGEYSNGGRYCCADTEIYNTTNSACQAPANASDCNKFDLVDDETLANCVQCKTDIQLVSNNGTPTCQTKTANHKYIYTDAYYEITNTNYNYCQKKGNDDVCTSCDSANAYLLLKACHSFEEKYTSATDYTSVALAVGNCKQTDDSNLAACTKCQANYTLTNSTTCTQQTGLPLTYCAKTEADNLDNCVQCEASASSYTSTALSKTICCPYFEATGRTLVPSSDYTACQPYMFEIEKCVHYDQTTNKCQECVENYYASPEGVCCQEGYYYKAVDRQCVQISASLLCLQLAGATCNKCIKEDNVYQATPASCCNLGKFYNGTNCANLTGNCLKANDDAGTCIECEKGYNLFNTTCCEVGKHLDGGNGCVDNTIDFCDYQTTTLTCSKCLKGYVLYNQNKYNNAKKDVCCKENQFYDYSNSICVEKMEIEDYDINCEAWDRKEMKCGRCKTGFYLTNGHCCTDDKHWDIIKNSCRVNTDLVTLSASLYTSCLQINDQNKCIKCAANSYLRTDNVCKQPTTVVNNCSKYDDLIVKCIQCDDGFYLHRDKCPALESQTEPGTGNIIAGSIDNCEIYGELDVGTNNCLKCTSTSNTYVTNNNMICCPLGQFYNATTSQCEATTEFANCIKFTTNEPHDCLECDKGYFLAVLKDNLKRCISFKAPDQECLVSQIGIQNNKNTFMCNKCKNEGIEYVLLPDAKKTQIFVKYEPVQNCEAYETTDLMGTSSLKCLRCIDNDLNYLTEINGIQVCLIRTQQVGDFMINHCVSFDPVKDDCLTCIQGYHLVTVPNDTKKRCQKNPTNCLIWNVQVLPLISYCSLCEIGFEIILIDNVPTCVPEKDLKQEEAPEPIFYPAYMTECVENEQCQDKFLGGLSGPLERLFSCHLCKYDGFIPFVSVRTNSVAIEGIQRYKKPESPTDRQDLEGGFKNSECLRVSGDSFGVDDSSFNFPQNCALGIINANLPPIADSNFPSAQKSRLGVYCAACEPGYKPIKSNLWDEYLHVYDCQFISNCEVKGDNFNQCDKCQDSYTFLFADGIVDKTKCVEFKQDENCEVTQYVNNHLVCKYCKEEYSFNYDGICEELQMNYCPDSPIDILPKDKRPTVFEYDFFINRFQKGFGCYECEDDLVSMTLKESDKSWFCTASEYIEKAEYIEDTKYDVLCKFYRADTVDLQCLICQPIAVLTVSNKCIMRNNALNNCSLALNEERCEVCDMGYILSFGECILKDIDNCVDYMIDPANGDLLCSECDIGYGLSKNVCVKDLFNPCLKINLQGECVACQYGFQLVTLYKNVKKCVPISSHQNCLSYNNVAFDNKQIQCQKCASNYFILKQLEHPLEVCNQIISIRNCIQYDIKQTFSSSTLKCLKCDPSYYLLGNECFLRRNLIDHCLLYEDTSEKCIKCASTHYLDTAGRYCVENPTGVDFCRFYKSNLVCEVCNTNYYPLNGKCKAVDKENLLQGCYTYNAQQKCVECQQEQIMLEGKCVSVLAQNCLELLNENQCATCEFGFELKEDETGIVNCVEIQKPVIQNCLMVSDTKPFTCLQCFEHHYFDSQTCIEIETSKRIDQCEIYETPVSCKQCQKYHVLAQDKTLCVLEKNRNCQIFEEQKKGFCVICQPGFQLNDLGKCVEVNPTRNKNCLLWQPESSLCLICKPGYQMNIPGTCVENQFTKMNPILQVENHPTAVVAFASLLKILSALFLLL